MPEDTNKKEMEKKTPLAGKAYKFIIGFIIVCAVLVFIISAFFLLIKVVPNTFNLVASTFQSLSDDQAPLTINKSVITSGETVRLSWGRSGTDIYTLTILCDTADISVEYGRDFYECRDSILLPTDATEIDLIVLGSKAETISFVLEKEDTRGAIETLSEQTLSLYPTDTEEDTTSLSLSSDSSTAREEVTTPSTIFPNGSDLSTHITSIGVIRNGQFINTNNVLSDDIVRVQFIVRNNGADTVSNWHFRAILPIEESIYTSTTQPTLTPGGYISYTLTFDGVRGGSSTLAIQADPHNYIRETDETNNTVSAPLIGHNSSVAYDRNDDADFDVELLATGRASGNRLVETRNLDTNDEVRIQFRVSNIGGEETDDRRFSIEVDDPDNNTIVDEKSRRYDSLKPGESIDITLTFDEFDEDGDYDFKIVVDPEKDTREESRSNNTLRFDLDIDD